MNEYNLNFIFLFHFVEGRTSSKRISQISAELSKYYGPAVAEIRKSVGRVFLVVKNEKSGKALQDLREL